jgi:hypothetical protein
MRRGIQDVILGEVIKKHLVIIGTIFTAALFGLVHIYTPVAQGLSSHSHSQHARDSSCQTLCQVAHEKQKIRTSVQDEQDKDPLSGPLYFNATAIDAVGVGLLRDGVIWRQSSWIPPDITLLSGHYSSSL